MDRGSWLAIVHGVTKSWAGLKQLNTENKAEDAGDIWCDSQRAWVQSGDDKMFKN